MKKMRILRNRNKNFKKVKISQSHQEYKRKKYSEGIIVINYYIIIGLKVTLMFIFICYSISSFSKKKFPQKVSDDIFNEMVSYVNAHNNITFEEIDSFRQFSREKKFIEQNPNFQKSENPILTVIMTMHNQAHCIHKCLRSIQNQSIKNIEILIIDDCSQDNSTETIEEFQKEDPRIILVKHDMNEGPIKSRSDGVRMAKGTYITIVDGDDALAHKDILEHSLYIAQKGNLDVTEFSAAYFKRKEFKTVVNAYSRINLTNIVYQPELRTKFFIISDNEGIRAVQSRCIYAKIVKNEVFKEALKFIGTKYTDDFILQYEDTIMTVGILQVAKSYYYIKELGYYYSRDQFGGFPKLKNKVCKPNHGKIRDLGHIKELHFLLDKLKNNEFERQLIYHELISIHHYASLIVYTNHRYSFVFEVLDALIQCRYLSNRQKQRLIDIKTRLENKKKGIK